MADWTDAETDWARECATAGDSPGEIAAMADRRLAEVEAVLADLKPMTPNERAVAQGLAAGMTTGEIDRDRGVDGARHIARRIRAKGYRIPDNQDRLDSVEIRAVARRHGFETLAALAAALGVPRGSSQHWSSRGLPERIVKAVLHA